MEIYFLIKSLFFSKQFAKIKKSEFTEELNIQFYGLSFGREELPNYLPKVSLKNLCQKGESLFVLGPFQDIKEAYTVMASQDILPGPQLETEDGQILIRGRIRDDSLKAKKLPLYGKRVYGIWILIQGECLICNKTI